MGATGLGASSGLGASATGGFGASTAACGA